MTEKQHFLLELKKALDKQQISDADAAPYLERFDRYYERIMAEPENRDGDPLDRVDTIADHIKKQLTEGKASADASPAVKKDPESQDPESQDPESQSLESQSLEPQDPEPQSLESQDQKPQDPDTAATITTDTVSSVDNDSELMISPENIPGPEESEENGPSVADRNETHTSGKFWGIFCACLPVTIPLALLLIALVGGIYLVGVGLIIAALGAMVAVIAVGSILAMIGFVYGAIQLFSEMAIGLYEIGLGLVCTGATMLIGILLYNFAIRLMPLLFKLFTRFVRFVFRKLKDLFFYCQLLCAETNK